MGDALLSGVAGLQAYQTMLDVTGNNIANVSTTAFKASQVTFADTLSSTIREATQSTATTGGTDPLQVGSGVEVANISTNTTQGTTTSTGQPLDMAIEGQGYFVVNNGGGDLYTRAGSFSVDPQNYLEDSATGYRVQRTGTVGVADGFQNAADTGIQIPYNTAIPANATSSVTLAGNLSADDTAATTNVLASTTPLLDTTSAAATDATKLTDIKGATIAVGDKFTLTGVLPDGSYVGGTAGGTTYTVASGDTVGTLLGKINAAYPGCTATIANGEITVTDNASGYSQTSLNLAYTPATGNTNGAFPAESFQTTTAGGDSSRAVTVDAYDSQGVSHTLTGNFVRNNATNTWDLVLTSAGDGATLIDQRINGISFDSNGSYGGIKALTGPDGTPTTDASTLTLKYGPNADTTTLTMDLGTVGKFDGLTEFSGSSTAALSSQDGYGVGTLSELSVTSNGVLTGSFTNGVTRDLAALKIATFQNVGGLKTVGNNFYESTSNSGSAVISQAGAENAGTVVGGSLEKSNVDISTEFVNLIQAQNAFQANARTITVANDMLKDLTNLIRD